MLEKDGGRDNKDSWTRAAEKRAMGGDDEGRAEGRDRNDRYGRYDAQDGERRNGFGEKGDPRWGNSRGDERRQNGDRPAGGWREREQARRNNGDRNHDEREPEWMDDPVVKMDQELGSTEARSQEEFQMWKDAMSKKSKGVPVKEEVVEAPPPPPEPKPNLKLDAFEAGGFFNFQSSGLPTPTSAATTPAASALPAKSSGKGKTSRFASMFKPAAEEPPPPPPEESDVQKAANGFAKTTAEDQEGFNRVLQMLGGGMKIGGQPTPSSESPSAPPAPQSPPQPTRAGANGSGSKPKSRFFQTQPKSPDRLQSPQQGGIQLGGESLFLNAGRGKDEPAVFGDRSEPPRAAQEKTQTPEPSNMFNALREQQPRPSSSRVNELAMFDPPSRGAPSPDINIQNLLAQQRPRPSQTSHESQNLLNLLMKSDPTGQLSRPQSQQTGDSAQLQRWLDHQHQANSLGGAGPGVETYAPKPARLPQQPPGLFEEQLMRNFPSREDLSREHQMPPGMPEPRRQQQRAPPGFYDEREILMQQQQQQQQLLQQELLQRRNYANAPPQQQQMPPAQQQQQFRKHQTLPSMNHHQQYQGEYHITSPNIGSAGGNGPPGFNPHMPRHPPGFGGNVPQQHFQQREPPPPGSMPPGFGPPSQGNAPPPPGFYNAPPPGFQNLRSPQEAGGMNIPPPPGMRGRPAQQFDPYEMGRRG
jgi:hypothetical protein